MNKRITLVECPRDAMQGWKHFIPTDTKAMYLNSLLKVGFDVLDFGSFVSPKAIPQLADTAEVIKKLDLNNTSTKLLAIIANTRGAEEAIKYDEITYLGFPFSISETFQMRNTNKTIAESLKQVEEMQKLCISKNKELVIYISMGFGNPYSDEYNENIVINWVKQLDLLGIKTIAIADTVGLAKPETITNIFNSLIPEFKNIEIGAHFHSTSVTWHEKIQTAYNSGCLRFDTAMKGIGGCPMAEDELVGNIATENVFNWCLQNNIQVNLNKAAFFESLRIAETVFVP